MACWWMWPALAWGFKVEEGGKKIRLQPGVLGGQANAALDPYGKKRSALIRPRWRVASIGGILSNNSSGMSSGVTQNAYHTLESLTFVLPSGTAIDTAPPDADEQFRKGTRAGPHAAGVEAKASRANPALAASGFAPSTR